MKEKPILSLILRYVILIAVALPNLTLFYFLMTPLTIYLTYSILNLLTDATIYSSLISINNNTFIQIIDACVAGSAYYLLLILNLSTPKINLKKRLITIISSFTLFLILNVSRILLTTAVLIHFPSYFDVIHKSFWYFSSIVFVISIWFLQVKLFKIKETPFYSDTKYLINNIKW